MVLEQLGSVTVLECKDLIWDQFLELGRCDANLVASLSADKAFLGLIFYLCNNAILSLT